MQRISRFFVAESVEDKTSEVMSATPLGAFLATPFAAAQAQSRRRIMVFHSQALFAPRRFKEPFIFFPLKAFERYFHMFTLILFLKHGRVHLLELLPDVAAGQMQFECLECLPGFGGPELRAGRGPSVLHGGEHHFDRSTLPTGGLRGGHGRGLCGPRRPTGTPRWWRPL